MTGFQTPFRRAYALLGLVALFTVASGGSCGNGTAGNTCDERLAGHFTVQGVIDDVTDTHEDFDDPNYFLIQTNKNIRFHIVLEMQSPPGALNENGKAELKGTATITWTSHTNNVNRTECAPGDPVIQYRDWDDRTWIAEVTATISCNADKELSISGIATPDGSQLGQFYHITENCTSFTRNGEDNSRATWSGFGPFGIDLDTDAVPLKFGEVIERQNTLLPDGVQGERYVEANLTVLRD